MLGSSFSQLQLASAMQLAATRISSSLGSFPREAGRACRWLKEACSFTKAVAWPMLSGSCSSLHPGLSDTHCRLSSHQHPWLHMCPIQGRAAAGVQLGSCMTDCNHSNLEQKHG